MEPGNVESILENSTLYELGDIYNSNTLIMTYITFEFNENGTGISKESTNETNISWVNNGSNYTISSTTNIVTAQVISEKLILTTSNPTKTITLTHDSDNTFVNTGSAVGVWLIESIVDENGEYYELGDEFNSRTLVETYMTIYFSQNGTGTLTELTNATNFTWVLGNDSYIVTTPNSTFEVIVNSDGNLVALFDFPSMLFFTPDISYNSNIVGDWYIESISENSTLYELGDVYNSNTLYMTYMTMTFNANSTGESTEVNYQGDFIWTYFDVTYTITFENNIITAQITNGKLIVTSVSPAKTITLARDTEGALTNIGDSDDILGSWILETLIDANGHYYTLSDNYNGYTLTQIYINIVFNQDNTGTFTESTYSTEFTWVLSDENYIITTDNYTYELILNSNGNLIMLSDSPAMITFAQDTENILQIIGTWYVTYILENSTLYELGDDYEAYPLIMTYASITFNLNGTGFRTMKNVCSDFTWTFYNNVYTIMEGDATLNVTKSTVRLTLTFSSTKKFFFIRDTEEVFVNVGDADELVGSWELKSIIGTNSKLYTIGSYYNSTTLTETYMTIVFNQNGTGTFTELTNTTNFTWELSDDNYIISTESETYELILNSSGDLIMVIDFPYMVTFTPNEE